jgi:hypothetical protein
MEEPNIRVGEKSRFELSWVCDIPVGKAGLDVAPDYQVPCT